MRQVATGHKIESEIGHSFDLESFLINLVTDIESEAGLPFSHIPPNLAVDLVTHRDLAQCQ